ncbi:universal stress protein [Larkinella soli]|uniref:universal stress protein n=1 Tax=Larkinella soli TaxID=1770527 RepID=UPI000FFB9E59|nr:universal stress protein [Larkinella soli]
MRNIVFATDFTETSPYALDWARLFARQFGATLTLLHVYQPMVPDTTLPVLNDPGEGLTASQDIERLSQQRLEQLAAQLTAEGLVVQTDWRAGEVKDEIMKAIADHTAHLLIISRHQADTFFDRLAGDKATAVAHDAPCPVLLIPGDEDAVRTAPQQIRSINYVMQQATTQAEASRQTSDLADAFGLAIHFVTVEQFEPKAADLVIVTDYRPTGLFTTNPADTVLRKAEGPVLVFHPVKES